MVLAVGDCQEWRQIGMVGIFYFEVVDWAGIRNPLDASQRHKVVIVGLSPFGPLWLRVETRIKPLAQVSDDVELALGNYPTLNLLGRGWGVLEERWQQPEMQPEFEESQGKTLRDSQTHGMGSRSVTIARQVTLDERAHHPRWRAQDGRWNLLVMRAATAQRLEKSPDRRLSDLDSHGGPAPNNEGTSAERLCEQSRCALD